MGIRKMLQSVVCLVLISAPSLGQSVAGGSGIPGFLASGDAARSRGTVVVCLALSDGLVLAADSRTTVTWPSAFNPNYKVASDSAEKLFDVGETAIASYGEAFLLGRSVGSIVADFDKDRRKKDTDVEEVARRFAKYITPIYQQHAEASKAVLGMVGVGFIIGGYNKRGIGEFLEITLPNQPEPQLLAQTTRANQGMIWRGQTDVIVRLIKGYDSALGGLPVFSKLSSETQKGLAADLNKTEYYIPYNYLALQDGIDLALSLVQVTVDMQRFSFGTVNSPGSIPGVGGAVDVLVINPRQLAWVKRKELGTK